MKQIMSYKADTSSACNRICKPDNHPPEFVMAMTVELSIKSWDYRSDEWFKATKNNNRKIVYIFHIEAEIQQLLRQKIRQEKKRI